MLPQGIRGKSEHTGPDGNVYVIFRIHLAQGMGSKQKRRNKQGPHAVVKCMRMIKRIGNHLKKPLVMITG